jgi:hypothetical protein
MLAGPNGPPARGQARTPSPYAVSPVTPYAFRPYRPGFTAPRLPRDRGALARDCGGIISSCTRRGNFLARFLRSRSAQRPLTVRKPLRHVFPRDTAPSFSVFPLPTPPRRPSAIPFPGAAFQAAPSFFSRRRFANRARRAILFLGMMFSGKTPESPPSAARAASDYA